MCPHKNYIWHRVRISPRSWDRREPWEIKELKKGTKAVGMLSGFRITPPGFQEERRAVEKDIQ
jgi:hypothetical protein